MNLAIPKMKSLQFTDKEGLVQGEIIGGHAYIGLKVLKAGTPTKNVLPPVLLPDQDKSIGVAWCKVDEVAIGQETLEITNNRKVK